MHNRKPRRFWRALVATVAASIGISLALTGCTPASKTASGDRPLVHVAVIGNASFVRNFNPFSPAAIGMTNHAVYESMLVVNLAKGNVVPWLAKGYDWSKDGSTLTFHLNKGVTWSDGKPMTASDVVYTFKLARQVLGKSAYPYVSNITAPDDATVKFTFGTAFTPGLYEIGQQVIVPEHIWKNVKNPATFQKRAIHVNAVLLVDVERRYEALHGRSSGSTASEPGFRR